MDPCSIQANSHATIDYELRDEQGRLIDVSTGRGGTPISYVHGYGMLVPGLEAALEGLRVGDRREVTVPADAGYGERDDSLVFRIARSELPVIERIEEGDELVAESLDGEEITMRVLEVCADNVLVDTNHPLAGMTLHYVLTVSAVRLATEQEIEHAARNLDEALERVLGPDCDPGSCPAVLDVRAEGGRHAPAKIDPTIVE